MNRKSKGASLKFLKPLEDKRTLMLTAVPFIIGLLIVSFNFLYVLNFAPGLFGLLNLFAALIVLVPPLLHQYIKYKHAREVESRFPEFMAAIVEKIKAGMTLPQAIKSAAKGEYGALNPLVRKMGFQIDWGIPFERILTEFAEAAHSKVLKRTASTIIETHRSGGNIADVLEAVSRNIIEINKIKAERSARIYAQMLTGYVIFFVFLGVMIGLQIFLIPALGAGGVAQSTSGQSLEDLGALYGRTFSNLIIIQAVFSGLAIGKMAEGSIIAGLKHSLVLLTIGYTLFVLLA